MSLWKCETRNGVVVARYLNPPMNYFCGEGAQELGALIATWAQDETVRAVVLGSRAEGRFITHYSVEELLSLAEDRDGMRAGGTALNTGYHALLQTLQDLPVPVIVALNGDAMGGGFELSLACDIRIASRGDFRFGLPEVKLGLIPGGGGTQRLADLLGAGRALDFILRGRIVTPEQALAAGLVHEVVDDAQARAEAIAHELASQPRTAVSMVKRALHQGARLPLSQGLQVEAECFVQTMLSDDGVAAMREYVALPLEQRRDWLERSAKD